MTDSFKGSGGGSDPLAVRRRDSTPTVLDAEEMEPTARPQPSDIPTFLLYIFFARAMHMIGCRCSPRTLSARLIVPSKRTQRSEPQTARCRNRPLSSPGTAVPRFIVTRLRVSPAAAPAPAAHTEPSDQRMFWLLGFPDGYSHPPSAGLSQRLHCHAWLARGRCRAHDTTLTSWPSAGREGCRRRGPSSARK